MSDSYNKWLENKKLNLEEKQVIKKDTLLELIESLKGIIFPGFSCEFVDKNTYLDLKINNFKKCLNVLLNEVIELTSQVFDVNTISEEVLEKLPYIDEMLNYDLDAIFEGDPAAESKSEIILCYPGFFAIFIFRFAHELASLNVPILPRVLSEYAHSKTGIDIHPKAKIGHHFFIDHGTGIVIGETTIIGNYVKIYQGVTLGALSLASGRALKDAKRHPTILDHVTIYSGASIFGGETVIGPNATIGSNAFITKSVEENDIITRFGKKKL